MCLRKSAVRPVGRRGGLAAYRANSQHSTGPRTPAGNARVALNALRYALRAVAPRPGPSLLGKSAARKRGG